MLGLTLMGLAVEGRQDTSPRLQKVLSEFGDQILLRVGLAVPDGQHGLITLVVSGEEGRVGELARRLEEVDGVTVRTLSF